jgi:heme/copper-type cytochrome/quinol oxidase subunit 2
VRNRCTLRAALLCIALAAIPSAGNYETGRGNGNGFLPGALKVHMCTDLGVCPITGVPVIRKYGRSGGTRIVRAMARKQEKQQVTWVIPFEAFIYGFSPERITIKQGDRVKLLVTSRDVPHCVVIKEFKVHVPVEKGTKGVVEFIADHTGEFTITCSLGCRNRHAGSTARLIVEE